MGPAVNTYESILELIDAGMNVARINFSHGTHEDHKKTIDLLKKARKEKQVPLAIMLDTKGPEIRVGRLTETLNFKRGDTTLLSRSAKNGGIPVNPPLALDPLQKGDLVLFDDGYIATEVIELTKEGALVCFLNSGHIKSQKGINMPGVNVPLPAMTEQDIEDIRFGCKEDVDFIAASFIRSAEHVKEIKTLLQAEGKEKIQIIAKIENRLGVENFDSIVHVADGIMIARGDLGVELPIEEVPVLQKMMIRKCIHFAKPVVTATQMLESMIENPRPTRAEASDVANAVYDSTSAIMLSGETAVGKYPIETVKLMRSIVEHAEKDFSFVDFFYRDSKVEFHDISSSIALASVKTAYSTNSKAIFAFTSSGSTARIISRFRPDMPIIALTANEKTFHQLAFNWGVIPVEPADVSNAQEALAVTSHFAKRHGLVQFGDLVVVTAGTPFGVSGTTNMMVVESIGEVIVRGEESSGDTVEGEIKTLLTTENICPEETKGKIVVLSKYDKSFKPFISDVKGILLENHPDDLDSEKMAEEQAKESHIPIIVRVDGALHRLEDGQFVVMDPNRGTVYKKMSSFHHEEDMFGISDS